MNRAESNQWVAAAKENIGPHEPILGLALELFRADEETFAHCERTAKMAHEFAIFLELDPILINSLVYAALLHDIGKNHLPAGILNKKTRLSVEEMKVVKTHPILGRKIIQKAWPKLADLSGLGEQTKTRGELMARLIMQIVHFHHERWDGKGYPEGLRGKLIPFLARVFTLVDVYDAMTTDRPYHEKLSHKEALRHMASGSGSHFDPELFSRFMQFIKNK